MLEALEQSMTTVGGCTYDGRRMTAKEMMKSSHISSAKTSPPAASEILGDHIHGRYPITDNLIDKIKRDSDERNIKLKSFPDRRNTMPAVPFVSVIDFRDDGERPSVTWEQPSVVTDIHYKPRVTLVEKRVLFYTEDETRR